MEFRYLPLIGGRLFLFAVQILILMGCIVYIQVVYTTTIVPDKLVEENFTETTCIVKAKQLEQEGHVIHRYRANFLIDYTVNSVPFENWVTGNGLDQSFFHEKGLQEETLTEFTVGASYPCWYNPQIPQIAVLVLRHNWMSTLPLAVPSIIVIITAYYLLKGIFQALGLFVQKAKEKKKRFKR